MIECGQICKYNFKNGGCLKPASAVCPMSNMFATDTNVGDKMTNADRIRAMNDEELAKWLEGIDCYNCDCCVYQHDCRFEYGDLERESYDCKKGRMEWLQQPVKEDA